MTIVGTQVNCGKKLIIKENLQESYLNFMTYKGNTHWTNTIFVDEDRDALVTGNENGHVIQYSLSTGRLIKKYTSIGIGYVVYFARINNILFFGGWNSHVRVLNINTREIFNDPFKTSVLYTLSMDLCVIPTPNKTDKYKVLLTTSGQYCTYNDKQSDVLNVTPLLKYLNVEIPESVIKSIG